MVERFFLHTSFGLIAFTIISCNTFSPVTKEEFIEQNKSLDPKVWNGWSMRHRTGGSYYMVFYQDNGHTLPKFIFFKNKESIMIRLFSSDSVSTCNIKEIKDSKLWNENYRHINVIDLKEKIEWVLQYNIDYVIFDDDTLFVKGPMYSVKKGLNDIDSCGWEDWPKGKYKNR